MEFLCFVLRSLRIRSRASGAALFVWSVRHSQRIHGSSRYKTRSWRPVWYRVGFFHLWTSIEYCRSCRSPSESRQRNRDSEKRLLAFRVRASALFWRAADPGLLVYRVDQSSIAAMVILFQRFYSCSIFVRVHKIIVRWLPRKLCLKRSSSRSKSASLHHKIRRTRSTDT